MRIPKRNNNIKEMKNQREGREKGKNYASIIELKAGVSNTRPATLLYRDKNN
jgi:hypothetical protein